MVGTNTHRLAAKEITLDEEAAAEGRFIVPAGILSDVSRILPLDDDKAQVEISRPRTTWLSLSAAPTSLPAW